MAKPDGGAAFPGTDYYDGVPVGTSGGMGLRDYFAAKVLPMAAHDLTLPEQVAERAYAIADAMLAERKK